MIDHLVIIDDEEINNFLTGELLNEYQHVNRSSFFTSAHDAIDFLKTLPKEDFPEIILMDLNLPGWNGFEFAEEFEKNFEDYFNTQIVILTNSISPSDKEKALSYNSVMHFLSKPLDEPKLNAVIKLYQEKVNEVK